LYRLKGFVKYSNIFANQDTLFIVPDPNSDYYGELDLDIPRVKESLRFNLYIT